MIVFLLFFIKNLTATVFVDSLSAAAGLCRYNEACFANPARVTTSENIIPSYSLFIWKEKKAVVLTDIFKTQNINFAFAVSKEDKEREILISGGFKWKNKGGFGLGAVVNRKKIESKVGFYFCSKRIEFGSLLKDKIYSSLCIMTKTIGDFFINYDFSSLSLGYQYKLKKTNLRFGYDSKRFSFGFDYKIKDLTSSFAYKENVIISFSLP